MPRTFLAVAVAVSGLVLSGCASTSSSTAGTGSTDRFDDSGSSSGARTPGGQKQKKETTPVRVTDAQGPVIDGSGYRFRVPKGWGPPRQPVPGFSPDSYALDLGAAGAFADNVNVLLSPAAGLTAAVAERSGRRELAAVGARDIVIAPRRSIAGAAAAHLRASMSLNGNAYTIEQFYPTHGGQTYVVTFSFGQGHDIISRAALFEPILATWQWTR